MTEQEGNENVLQKITDMQSKARGYCDWIRSNVKQDKRSLILHNLLSGCLPYLELVRSNPSYDHIQVIALSTRSIFEIDVRLRHVLKSEENLNLWGIELLKDELELIDSVLGLVTPNTNKDAINELLTYKTHIHNALNKNGFSVPPKRPRISDLAKDAGLEVEYNALSKLSSKLLHPTSYSLNGKKQNIYCIETYNILITGLQNHFVYIMERIRKEFNISI